MKELCGSVVDERGQRRGQLFSARRGYRVLAVRHFTDNCGRRNLQLAYGHFACRLEEPFELGHALCSVDQQRLLKARRCHGQVREVRGRHSAFWRHQSRGVTAVRAVGERRRREQLRGVVFAYMDAQKLAPVRRQIRCGHAELLAGDSVGGVARLKVQEKFELVSVWHDWAEGVVSQWLVEKRGVRFVRSIRRLPAESDATPVWILVNRSWLLAPVGGSLGGRLRWCGTG